MLKKPQNNSHQANNLKYLLPSNEQGVVVSLDEPIYLIASKNTVLYGMNRQQKMVQIEINPTEFLFKYYLEQHQYRNALRIIRQCHLDSKAIIGYLQRSGYEDIALAVDTNEHDCLLFKTKSCFSKMGLFSTS